MYITKAPTSEVMMARMLKVYGDKMVFGTEVFKEGRAVNVSGVAIGITSDINWAVIEGSNVLNK